MAPQSNIFSSAGILAPNPGEGYGGSHDQYTAKPLQNRIGGSRSPYLRRHEDSLVAWQPLDNESIERANRENKLILLHIGFNACHYCRLMSTESFSNPECASVINASFVPVIVDREQRPDLDTIYMNYVQAVSNAGGWPLNLFLTPELEPVFGGTYWPGPSTTTRASSDNEDEALDFLSILKKVRAIWSEQEPRCRKEATEVLAQLREFAAEGTIGTRGIVGPQPIVPSGLATAVPTDPVGTHTAASQASSELDLDQLEEAYTYIAGTFDPVYGGFGLAPKFLTPNKLGFLLRLSKFPGAVQDVVGEAECKHAADMAIDTLRKIRDGALRDHIGGTGFARCSVTPDWSIPNFERLVVDNAQLLLLYIEAWQSSGGKSDDEFYDVVVELIEYLTSRPVALPAGGFASSEAADSYYKRGDREMQEGAFYLWTRREFDLVVDADDRHISPIVAAHWDVQEDGNVDEDHDPNDDFINQNILKIVKTPEELGRIYNLPVEQVKQSIQTAKTALRQRMMKERVRPELDEKIITGWNGLVISALAKASSALKDVDVAQSENSLRAAIAAVSFIKSNLWDHDAKRLYRVWNGEKETEAFADDYAYLIQGLLSLFQSTNDESLLEFADELQKTQASLFYDPAGAFYSTMASSPHTILRLKDGMDSSLPSINAVSVSNLFTLGSLLDEDKFTTMARDTINAFEAEMLQHPGLFTGLLAGVVTARLGAEKTGTEPSYKTRRQKA